MKGRILVVDDEADIRLILRSTLEEKFEVVEAHDGLDALEKLERYEPDFVCLDVMMPLMDGFETCESIRKNPRFAATPVMFLTAMAKKEDMRAGYSKGANLYLTKPFEPDRLLKNIDVQFREMKNLREKRYSIGQIREMEASKDSTPDPGSPTFELPGNISAESRDKIMRSTRQIEKPAEAKPPALKPRILLIDDDPDILMIMQHSLEDHAEIVTANDGIEAVQHLVKYQPDILVIDIMLPKMNGFQLCQSLRANRAFEKIPILMCSAKAHQRDIDMAKRSGADDFLAKPFDPQGLLEKIQEIEKIPAFRIRPVKKMTWEEIQEELKPEEEEADDVFGAQEAEHRERLEAMAKQAEKEALDAHDRVGEDGEKTKKKKRRLFGFGG